jgi:hypothetical protein
MLNPTFLNKFFSSIKMISLHFRESYSILHSLNDKSSTSFSIIRSRIDFVEAKRNSAAARFFSVFSYDQEKNIFLFNVCIKKTCAPNKGPQKLPIVYMLVIANLMLVWIIHQDCLLHKICFSILILLLLFAITAFFFLILLLIL